RVYCRNTHHSIFQHLLNVFVNNFYVREFSRQNLFFYRFTQHTTIGCEEQVFHTQSPMSSYTSGTSQSTSRSSSHSLAARGLRLFNSSFRDESLAESMYASKLAAPCLIQFSSHPSAPT